MSSSEGYMEKYDKTNEPLFIKILHEIHVCLGCDKCSGKDTALHVSY